VSALRFFGIFSFHGPGPAMNALYWLINSILDIYIWCLIIWVIMSWLISFNVINTRNQFVRMIGDFLYRITEPALRQIRRFLPTLGGIDLSPLALILMIYFIQIFLRDNWPA
jgi:YggT family protein